MKKNLLLIPHTSLLTSRSCIILKGQQRPTQSWFCFGRGLRALVMEEGMQYRRLGSAGVKVSAVSLGGWINYGEGKVEQESAKQVVERARSLGINFFDLADVYGKGGAEQQMGAMLKPYPRHELVVSTK